MATKKIQKRRIMQCLGIVAFIAFLVVCSEPAPGEDISVWEMAWPKLAALATIGASVWAIKKIDGERQR